MKRNGQEGYSFCGGVLISKSKGQLLMILLILLFFIIAENYVLTAAHCIANDKNGVPVQNVEVILGAHKIKEDESSQVRLTSTEFFHHEQYDSQSINNDIGLVKLPQSVTQSKYLNYSQSISIYYIHLPTQEKTVYDLLIINNNNTG